MKHKTEILQVPTEQVSAQKMFRDNRVHRSNGRTEERTTRADDTHGRDARTTRRRSGRDAREHETRGRPDARK